MCIYVYVYMYIYIYICIYVCMCVYAHIHIYYSAEAHMFNDKRFVETPTVDAHGQWTDNTHNTLWSLLRRWVYQAQADERTGFLDLRWFHFPPPKKRGKNIVIIVTQRYVYVYAYTYTYIYIYIYIYMYLYNMRWCGTSDTIIIIMWLIMYVIHAYIIDMCYNVLLSLLWNIILL